MHKKRGPLTALVLFLAALSVCLAGCAPAESDDQVGAGSSSPVETTPPQDAEGTLSALREINTSVESFRVIERQVDSGVRDSVPWTKTNSILREYQAPDRTRIIFYATEYVRDLDNDGIFEDEVAGGSDCEAQEALTIATAFYERCDDDAWAVTQLSGSYVMPVQSANDLLGKVEELEELRLLAKEMIDGRPTIVFDGNMPGLPPDIHEATRTVWVDEETALLRRIVEIVRWEEPTGDEPPDTVATEDYVDYSGVTIMQPDVGQTNTS